MTHKVITLMFCLLLTVSVESQDRLWFEEINIDNGLSQPTILCLLQDTQGFIWIGTQFGLNRFDGYQFETYKNINNDESSLSSNYIISLFEDSSGTLWVGTNDGLNAFDKSSNTFKRYKHDLNKPKGISNNIIADIAEDQEGYIWLATAGGGLNRFDQSTQSFTQLLLSPQNPLFLTHLLFDDSGLLWVTTGKARMRPANQKGEIFLVDPKLLSVTQIKPEDQNGIIEMKSVTAIFQDNKQDIWFGTLGNGLIKKSAVSNKFKHITNPQLNKIDSITAITQDRQGRFWFATQYKGLFRYDESSDVMLNYDSKSLERSNLNDDDIISLLVDDTGVFWVGTWTEGIKKVDFESFQFQKYLQLANKNHSAHQDVLDINQDSKGNIWLATWENGLLQFNLKTGKTIRPEILSLDVVGLVRHIFIDKQDKLWLGTNDKGLIFYDPSSQVVKSYNHQISNPNSISTNKIINITDDSLGNLWIATRGGGLNYFDRTNGVFTHFIHDDNNLNSISDDRVSSLFMDENEILWVGTNVGLDIFDPKSNKVLYHYQEGKNPTDLLGKSINTIYQDRMGRTWVGTEKGISRIEFSEINHYENLSFLWDIGFGPSQIGSVGGILDDNNGNLWISSFKYITRYNPTTQSVKNYSNASGVLVGGYYIGSSYEDEKGRMYFGGLNGLTVFKAETKQKQTIAPKVVLTRLLLFNKPVYVKNDPNSVLKTSIDQTKQLDFNYKQNVFSIEFSALHYSSPKDNQYAYKLDGFDKQWFFTDSNHRRATYTNLDPGDYQFFIKASNNEGIWSPPIHKLNIHVHAAPWKTNLAYFIYFVIISSIIGGFVWLRIKQMQAIKLRNEQLSLTSKLFENTSECVWLLDSNLNFLTVNDGLCHTMGYLQNELIGNRIQVAHVHGQDEEFFKKTFQKVKKGGRWEGEMWAQRKSGETFPIDIVIDRVSLRNAHNHIFDIQYVGVFSDITLRKKTEDDLRTMAYFDNLTHLANRAYFKKLVQKVISQVKISPFLIFYFDLDNFKNINDSLGHSYGDELLVTIAKRLQDYSDAEFLIARMGGDEFALMIPQLEKFGSLSDQANQIGNELLKLVRKKVVIKKHSLHVSTSIGVSVYPDDGKSHEELLRNADTAMYDAKKNGGNDFTLYSKKMNKAARKRLMLEDELNKAIVAQEIFPYYQPKVLLDSGEICGMEILARWKHKKLGWISPDEFIPVAEESNLINRISDQLLTSACQFILPLIQQGQVTGRMSFNISISQFRQVDIVSRIDKILAECQFPAECLEIEITESMVMGNIKQAIKIMKQFKSRNISIAIDDFGTGYSSLSYLKKFPIDTLKIDISFIKDLITSHEDRKIVNSIIHLAHSLGLQVVAEGAEKLGQVLILKNMGCELLQGFYYSKALSENELLMFLTDENKLYDVQTPV